MYTLAAGTTMVARDPRIKAIIGFDPVYEKNGSINVSQILGTLNPLRIPSLNIVSLYHSSDNQVAPKSSATVIGVSFKEVEHTSYTSIVCNLIEVNREIAIGNGVNEPLANPEGDPWGIIAWNRWHADEPPITAATGQGGGRQFCDVSAWPTPVQPSLIYDNENVTQEQEIIRRVRLFSLSFWKTYLVGESGFETYLTPQYTKDNFEANDVNTTTNKL